MTNRVNFEWTLRRNDYHNYESNFKELYAPYHLLFFGYPNLDVRVHSRSYLVDFNTLVSAVGGGLGLFLGMSVIDSLFRFYNWIFGISN